MKNILILLPIVYLSLMALLYFFQRNLLYFPTPEAFKTQQPSFVLLSDGYQIKVVTDGTRSEDSQQEDSSQKDSLQEKAVIYFGGNAESAWWSPGMMEEAFAGHTAYYLNYPGYGGSEGAPTEENILKAAQDLFDYVQQRHESVSLVGRSLGSGVAIALANSAFDKNVLKNSPSENGHKVASLVLITPYDSIASVAASHYPVFPVKWLIKDKFDSLSRLENIDTRVLILIGSIDTVIPPKHSHLLLEALKNHTLKNNGIEAESITFDGYGHNDISSHPDFHHQIKQFL